MQVDSSVNNKYYTQYHSSSRAKKSADTLFSEKSYSSNETISNQKSVGGGDYQEFCKAGMTHGTTIVRGCQDGDISTNFVEQSRTVSMAETEDGGEFLGLTMVPEEGQSVIYGMRAMLSDRSTPDNPIVQVVSNLGGKKTIYDVEVNKVNPNNATQLEMFALLSYTDKMGITDGGTFGSHQQLEVYGENATGIGYCGSLSGADTFLNEKFNWTFIMEKMAQVYMNAGIKNQADDCKTLVDFFTTYTEQYEIKEEATIEFSRFVSNGPEKVVDYAKILEEKINEIFAKIQNGDTEPTYQIGAQSFTEKQWEEFLDKFDSVEEAIREMMKEEQTRKETEEEKKRNVVMDDISMLLTTESTSCVYATAGLENDDLCYITWYTEEGIFCRKAGQIEGYEWYITFENKEQYDKVMEFIGQFPSDWNMRFAAHENFWNDFLNDEIDMGNFMEFINGTNKGVPDFTITEGDSEYIDKDKMRWAKYMNPLNVRFYTTEEMHRIQMEIIVANMY